MSRSGPDPELPEYDVSRGLSVLPEALRGVTVTADGAKGRIIPTDTAFIVKTSGEISPEELAANLLQYFPGQKRILLAGVLKDKDYAAIFSRLRSAAEEVCCITPASTRALPAEDLATFLCSAGWTASAYSSVAEGVSAAVDRAKETGGMVCAAGSLYLAGPIRELFGCY